MTGENHHSVTRSDFDGLVCGMLLRELDLIDEARFVHPEDMQDGSVPITARDIVTNPPSVSGAHLVFDHHASEVAREDGRDHDSHVIDPDALSTARVVYDRYGGAGTFTCTGAELMAAVDKTVFAVGKSILDRGSPVDVGAVCLRLGGGGHMAAGTCQVPDDRAEAVREEPITVLGTAPARAAA